MRKAFASAGLALVLSLGGTAAYAQTGTDGNMNMEQESDDSGKYGLLGLLGLAGLAGLARKDRNRADTTTGAYRADR